MALTSRVPSAKKVNTAGEEAGLQETEDQSQRRELAPLLNETHPNHYGAPEQGDTGYVDPGANLSDDDGRGGLEDCVRDEEKECYDALQLY